MKIRTNDLGNRRVELTIEVGNDRVEPAMRALARQYARQLKIPGFRPGKAPFALVAQRVGTDRLLQEVLERLGPEIYQEALAEANLEAYQLESLNVVAYDPLTLQATVSLVPTVKLGDYRALRVEPKPVIVRDEDVERALTELREGSVQLAPVNRPAAIGDHVIADVKIEIDETPIYDRKNLGFVLSPDGITGVPKGFVKQVAGMEIGEKRVFDLRYSTDYGDKGLAGQEVTITVMLHEVKERQLPELDDELAQTVGGFDTLDELRDQVRESLQSRAEISARRQLNDRVMARVMGIARVEYPPAVLEAEIDQLMRELEVRLADRGFTLDNYLVMEGKTRESLRDEMRAEAEQRIRRSVILHEVAEREGLHVSEEEINQEVERVAGLYGAKAAEARQKLSAADSRRSVASRLRAEKALNRLVEIATSGSVEEANIVVKDEGIEEVVSTAEEAGESAKEHVVK